MINSKLLMSGIDDFRVTHLNPHIGETTVDYDKLSQEYNSIKKAFIDAGIEIVQAGAPEDCPDGVFAANWAVCVGDLAIMAVLPNERKGEEEFAEKALIKLGKHILKPPYRFSGQGDALICGNYLFMGYGYRTDARMEDYLKQHLDLNVIAVRTVPLLGPDAKPVINEVTGWADSYFYDIDLALAVISPNLIAWCPEAFTPESRQRILDLPIQKITVSYDEARNLACNLVSTGETVIMGNRTPNLRQALIEHGLKVTTVHISELSKGGGFIRCVSLAI